MVTQAASSRVRAKNDCVHSSHSAVELVPFSRHTCTSIEGLRTYSGSVDPESVPGPSHTATVAQFESHYTIPPRAQRRNAQLRASTTALYCLFWLVVRVPGHSLNCFLSTRTHLDTSYTNASAGKSAGEKIWGKPAAKKALRLEFAPGLITGN
ncbi:hypothetical protein Aduo_008576 [Ancylostoma duodenale]